MRITRIENQKNNPSRRSLYADDRFLLGVSQETLLRFGVRVGDEIGEERLHALQAADELHSAKNAALRFLTRRQRTVREVRDKLREKEFSDEDIARAIDDLSRSGLLNDEEFARSFIRNQLAVRPKGSLVLKQKLLLLGVERTIIEKALQDILGDTQQEDVALTAARTFLGKSSLTRDDPRKRRQKLMAFLSRRGFTWDIISSVTKQALDSPGGKDADK